MNDRIAFAYDVMGPFGKSLTAYQEEILGYLDEGYTRIAIRGPHGLGKTFLAALLTHHSVLTAENDAKTITTASAWRQLEKYLWPEIHKLSKSIRWDIVGRVPYIPLKEIMGISIRLSGRTVEAFAVASDDHTTIEGAHAKQLIYIFDEAKAIPRPTWNAAEGAFSNAKNVNVTLDNSQTTLFDNGLKDGLDYTGRIDLIPYSEQAYVDPQREILAARIHELTHQSTQYKANHGIAESYWENVDENTQQIPTEFYIGKQGNREHPEDIYTNDPSTHDAISIDDNDVYSTYIDELSSDVVQSNGSTHVPESTLHTSTNEGVHEDHEEHFPNRQLAHSKAARPLLRAPNAHGANGTHVPNGTSSTRALNDTSSTHVHISHVSSREPVCYEYERVPVAHDHIHPSEHVINGVSSNEGVLQAHDHIHPNEHVSTDVSRNVHVLSRRGSREKITLSAGTTEKAYAFAISTPGDPSGQFYDIHTHKPGYEDWKTRHVTVDEAIRAGRISVDWMNQRKRQWGETSSIYQNRVLGEFADSSEEGIIPLSWVRAANERWKDWKTRGAREHMGRHVLGIDVARGGDDKTVVARCIAPHISELFQFSKLSVTSVAGFIKSIARGYELHIEMDGGLGASVYDILREEGVPLLRPITVSSNTNWRDRSKELRFLNVRAAMWWNVRQMLDPQYGSEVMLPPVEELTLDLTTPKWEIMKDATVRLESKDSIRDRLGRSTDYGDAVCLAFWQSTSGGGAVI